MYDARTGLPNDTIFFAPTTRTIARIARVGFCGEVRGGDDADYEAELLEGPACMHRAKRVSIGHPGLGGAHLISSTTSILTLERSQEREKKHLPMMIPQEVYFSGLLAATA
jgi:hypothetical protein